MSAKPKPNAENRRAAPPRRRLRVVLALATACLMVLAWQIYKGPGPRLTLRGHGAPVNRVAFSRDGRLIAAATADGTVRIWDAQSGKELSTMPGTATTAMLLHFTVPGGKPGEKGGEIDLPEAPKHQDGKAPVRIPSPDKTVVAVTGTDNAIVLQDGAGKQTAVLVRHAGPVRGMTFSPDGATLASTSGGPDGSGEVVLWDVAAAKFRRWLIRRNDFSPTALVFSPDGSALAVAAGSTVEVWDAPPSAGEPGT